MRARNARPYNDITPLRAYSASAPYGAVFSEEEAYCPDSGEGDDYIDNARKHRADTAEKPSDKVKTEDTEKTPVKTADNQKN
jgi:hypothetical protein